MTNYIVLTGFSVGISDLIADRETNEKIKNTIVKKKKDLSKLVQQVHQQMFENNGTDTVSNECEKSVNNILNKAIADAGKIGLNSLAKDNRMTNMVSSGSKGKPINIAQMVACLGQQNVDGKRIQMDTIIAHSSLYHIMYHLRRAAWLKTIYQWSFAEFLPVERVLLIQRLRHSNWLYPQVD